MSRTAAKTANACHRGRLVCRAARRRGRRNRAIARTACSPPQPVDGEIARPQRVVEAMRYASLGGGKRLRPFLAVETAALFGVPRERALMAGAAIELRALLFAGA